MARQNATVQLVSLLTMAVLVSSCASPATQTTPTFGLRVMPPVSPIPADVQQMAVLYPRGRDFRLVQRLWSLGRGGIPAQDVPPEAKDH